jgi:hypothetical protein
MNEKTINNARSYTEVQRGYLAAVLTARLFSYARLLRRLPRFLVPAAQPPNVFIVSVSWGLKFSVILARIQIRPMHKV